MCGKIFKRFSDTGFCPAKKDTTASPDGAATVSFISIFVMSLAGQACRVWFAEQGLACSAGPGLACRAGLPDAEPVARRRIVLIAGFQDGFRKTFLVDGVRIELALQAGAAALVVDNAALALMVGDEIA